MPESDSCEALVETSNKKKKGKMCQESTEYTSAHRCWMKTSQTNKNQLFVSRTKSLYRERAEIVINLKVCWSDSSTAPLVIFQVSLLVHERKIYHVIIKQTPPVNGGHACSTDFLCLFIWNTMSLEQLSWVEALRGKCLKGPNIYSWWIPNH